MSAAHGEYALGRTQQEYERLARQAAILEPMTRRTFTDAGVSAGMRVLDLGSGAGDVSLLLAEMVGSAGSVVGLDLDAAAIAHARERVAAAGIRNVTFEQCDFLSYVSATHFDAIVGRLILFYQAEPAASLAAVARYLKPGGAVAFMEPWFRPLPVMNNVMGAVVTLIHETFRRSGAQMDLGPRLHNVFVKAGLPLPKMRFEYAVDGAPDSPLFQYMTDTYANLLPKAMEYGIPTAEKLATLEEIPRRMAEEAREMGYAAMVAPLFSAWTKTRASSFS